VIVTTKVNQHFKDQVTFTKNFLIELSNIYIQSFPEGQQETVLAELRKLLGETLEEIINRIEIKKSTLTECPKCKAVIELEDSMFCSKCGAKLDRTGE
jgi:hypothetical protein